MKYLNLESKNGQSLIEILVAFSIFVVGISTVFFLVLDSNSSVRQGLERSQAVLLAQEGIEASRSIRDSGFGNLINGAHGIVLSGGNWSFSGTSNSQDQFIRAVTITEINSDTKKIESRVSWPFSAVRTGLVSFTSYLTNWQKRGGKGGMLAYADLSGTNKDVIRYKILDANGDWGPEQTVPDLGVPLHRPTRRLELYSSPTRNEKILITKHFINGAGDDQYIYGMIWNGSSWSSPIQLASWTGSVRPEIRGFDGAYLNNGNFLIVYEDDTNIPKYRIWNGTTLIPQTNTLNVGGNPDLIIVRNRPGTNEAMIIIRDANNDTNSMYFNGSSFSNLTEHAINSSGLSYENISFEWSLINFNVGALMFQETSDNFPNVRPLNTGAWGSTVENYDVGGLANILQIEGRPGVANEFLGCVKDSANDINCIKSNSTPPSWLATTNGEIAINTDNGTQRSFAVGYEQNSGAVGLAVYANGVNATQLAIPKYRIYEPVGSNWSSEFSLNTLGSGLKSVEIIPDSSSDDLMVLMGANDLSLSTAVWDGTNNSFYTTSGRSQMVQSIAGSNALDFWFDFAWDN